MDKIKQIKSYNSTQERIAKALEDIAFALRYLCSKQ